MNSSVSAASLLGVAAILFACTATAAPSSSPSVDALIASCHPGRAHAETPTEGSTPTDLKGARIVSAGETNCLISKLGKDLTVIAALDEERRLPGAVSMTWAATSGSNITTRLKETLALMGKGKPGDPLLMYCHHASCGYSYRAAAHAVDAGYRHVFWFRDGMTGWAADGYAFAGEENQGLADRFTRRLAACNRNVLSNQEIIQGMATNKPGVFEARYAQGMKANREQVRACLLAVDADFGADKARKSEVAREIVRADGVIEKALPSARAALDADARVYLERMFNMIEIDRIDAYVSEARSLKSVDASCPPPTYVLPRSVEQASKTRGELEKYASCMNKLKNGSLSRSYSVEALGDWVNLVAFAEPYVCGRSRSKNCLPEATWRKVALTVSADRLRAIAQGEATRKEMLQQMLVAQTRLNDYTPMFVQAESLLDSQEEARSQSDNDDAEDEEEEQQTPNRPTSSGFYYTPPQQPQPAYRPPSNVSAGGIR